MTAPYPVRPHRHSPTVATDILASMQRRIDLLELDLRGFTVVTEAATGSYACTATLAAMAGARVYATARDTRRYGSFEDAVLATTMLAESAGVANRITISRTIDPAIFAECGILTNSAHLRPITAETISLLPREAVIALMFEAWEFRGTDLDLAACRSHGIRVAAVNERHPDVAVFPFLGPLVAQQLVDAQVALCGARVTVVCDNPFAPFLKRGLIEAGAFVVVVDRLGAVPGTAPDAVVVAVDPSRNVELGERQLRPLANLGPGTLLAQFWGDIDRAAASRIWRGRIWPPEPPAKGHMAVLLSELGYEPVVRLQAGGLRAAELVSRREHVSKGGVAELL